MNIIFGFGFGFALLYVLFCCFGFWYALIKTIALKDLTKHEWLVVIFLSKAKNVPRLFDATTKQM